MVGIGSITHVSKITDRDYQMKKYHILLLIGLCWHTAAPAFPNNQQEAPRGILASAMRALRCCFGGNAHEVSEKKTRRRKKRVYVGGSSYVYGNRDGDWMYRYEKYTRLH